MFINSAFFYLWLAQALSQFATNILLFFITFFIYKKTTSNIAVSVALLVYLLPSFASSILAGVAVDRMGKKWILFLTTLLRALFVFLMFATRGNVFYLYGLIFLLALTTQFFTPAESAIIPKIVPADKLVAANAYFATTINLSLIAGFLLSPIFFKLLAFKTVFFIFGAYLMGAIILFFLPLSEPWFYTNFRQPLAHLAKKFSHHLGVILSNFFRDRKLNRTVFSIIFLQVVLFILIAVSPGFADKILRVPVEDLSFLIVFPTALGFLAASLIVHRLKQVDEVKVNRFAFLACALIFLLIFVISQFRARAVLNILNFLLLAGFGVFAGLVMILAYAAIQKQTREERRAGYFGVLNAFINLASAIPVFLSGVLSDLFGVDKIVLVLGIVFLLLAMNLNSTLNPNN